MKYYWLIFIFISTLISACNNVKNGDETNKNIDSSTVAKTTLTDNSYKRLEGSIAGKPVVMHLQSINGEFDGDYYYDGSWLNLSTDTLIGMDSLILSENSFNSSYFEQNPKQPKLLLKWTGNGFTGTWQNGEKTKSYPILLNEKYPDGSYEFSTGIYEDSLKANTNQVNSPVAQISFEYLKANSTDETGNWLNTQLKKIQNVKPSVDREIGFKTIASAYFNDYKSQIAEQQKNGRNDGFQAWMNYTNNSQQSILYNNNGYIVIDFLADAYTGGAHGNYSSTLYNLDVLNKKQLVLSDLVKIDSGTLQNLLEQNFKKQYNIKVGESVGTVLFDNYLKPNNNFYFNGNGLAFMYNPYEVASYAQGQIVVYIPFIELKPYLVPGFAVRMGLK